MLVLLVTDERAPLGVGGIAHEVHTLYARWYAPSPTAPSPPVTRCGSTRPARAPSSWRPA